MSGPERDKDDEEREAEDAALAEAEAQAEAEAEEAAARSTQKSVGAPAGAPPHVSVGPSPPSPVEDGYRRGEFAPHEAQHYAAGGGAPDPEAMARRGRFKLAIATTIALTVVFFQLLWLLPGAAVAFGAIVAPLMIYLIRITRVPLANEGKFRRGMAMGGSIFLAIIGSFIFLFMTFVTIVAIICSGIHV